MSLDNLVSENGITIEEDRAIKKSSWLFQLVVDTVCLYIPIVDTVKNNNSLINQLGVKVFII